MGDSGQVGDTDQAGGGRKTLIVLRHAKAGHKPGSPDRERPLTERGERDARAAGEQIRRLNPELVLCSPSVRTRRTAELLGLGVPVEIEGEIYEAYSDDLFDVLRRTDPEVGTLVLVGHNPGVHELVWSLGGTEVDGFPPAAFAVFELDGAWREIAPGTGRLMGTHQP